MALRSFTFGFWTPTNTADTTNLADATHMSLLGGSATQRFRLERILISGLASASAVNQMVVAYDSTIGATLTALAAPASDNPLDASAVALATTVKTFTAATTKPQRLALGYLLWPALNAFGGIVNWNTSPNEVGIWGLGNGTATGEITLSAKNDTGTAGAISSTITYEPY